MTKRKQNLLNYQILGAHIKTRRREKNITQEALAARCHCTVTHLSHIENGNGVGLETLVRICAHLGISLDDAMGITYAEKPLHREMLDLFLAHTHDEQQLAIYLLRCFYLCLDLSQKLKRGKNLQKVLRDSGIDFEKVPQIELFEETDRQIFRPKKQPQDTFAAEKPEKIALPSKKPTGEEQ